MLDYAERLQEPGYNVMERVPGKQVWQLVFKYEELGHRALSLLTATDRKWMVEQWGEPESHTTLNAMYRDLWERHEEALVNERQEDLKRGWDALAR